MTKSKSTRKARPLLLTATVLLFLLVGYFGAYWANATGKQIDYPSPDGNPFNTRYVAEFVVFQEVSEIVFWPADELHGWIRPDRFDDPSEWPDFRDDWW